MERPRLFIGNPPPAVPSPVTREHGGGAGRGATLVLTLRNQEQMFEAGKAERPDAEFGTSIGAWHAAAVAAGLLDELEEVYRKLRGRKTAMRLDLNPFDGDGIGYELDRLMELATGYGIGEGMKVPTFVGVVDLREWAIPDPMPAPTPGAARAAPLHLPGHVLVRIDELPADEARMWMARSSCQRPFHAFVGTKDDGPQWVDGGWSAVVTPSDHVYPNVGRVYVNACSTLIDADRREKRTLEDVRQPWNVASIATDGHVDAAVQRDRLRLQRLAAEGVRVDAWWAPTLAEVRAPFDLSRATTVHRLDTVGPRVWDNWQVFMPDGPRKFRNPPTL